MFYDLGSLYINSFVILIHLWQEVWYISQQQKDLKGLNPKVSYQESSMNAKINGRKYDRIWDIYIVAKYLPKRHLVFTKGKRVI